MIAANGSALSPIPTIYGIGDSLIYFVDKWTDQWKAGSLYEQMGFVKLDRPDQARRGVV